jgi:hypothetical protein
VSGNGSRFWPVTRFGFENSDYAASNKKNWFKFIFLSREMPTVNACSTRGREVKTKGCCQSLFL